MENKAPLPGSRRSQRLNSCEECESRGPALRCVHKKQGGSIFSRSTGSGPCLSIIVSRSQEKCQPGWVIAMLLQTVAPPGPKTAH